MKKRAYLLLVIGLLGMTGNLFDLKILKGLGLASAAAPAPKVFCSADGLETFSSRFLVEYLAADGTLNNLELTPRTRMRGPYNRRNVYGAVLAYGPVLPANLRDPVLEYALGPKGTLRDELGLPADAEILAITVDAKVAPAHLNLRLEPDTREVTP